MNVVHVTWVPYPGAQPEVVDHYADDFFVASSMELVIQSNDAGDIAAYAPGTWLRVWITEGEA
jgi:hypothetical protein